MIHLIELKYSISEPFAVHYDRCYEAARWCESNIGKQFSGWDLNMRAGDMPFHFYFKKPNDVMR